MKKKIYILAVTFLCLLCSQLSYGFGGEGNYGDEDDWGVNNDLDRYIEDLRNLLGEDRVTVYDDNTIYLFVENHKDDLHYETESIYEDDINSWMQNASALEKSLAISHSYTDANGNYFSYYTIPISNSITFSPTFNIDGYDKDGFDLFGYDRDGFNQNGYNDDGYNRDGYDLTGYDQNGFDQNGYDNLGYDWFGYDSNGFDSRGNEASDYDSNGYDDTGYDQTGHDADGYSDPNAPENYKRRWFVDKDNDNYSSEVVYFDAFELKNYPYKLTVFGPDCDDNPSTGANVNKLNKCGKCEVEPVSCGSGKDCDLRIDDMVIAFPNTNINTLKEITDAINKHGKDYGLDTKEKMQHFLAQAGHESKNVVTGKEFEGLVENGGFRWKDLGSSKSRYFNPLSDPTKDSNKGNPNDFKKISDPDSEWVDAEKMFNFIYDDNNPRRKNKIGNTSIGDGYKYRGRGIWQLTGKANYTEFNSFYQGKYGTTIDLVNNPNLVGTNKEIAVISALWYYQKKVKIQIDENTTVESVTVEVNGGKTHLSEREKQYTKVKNNIINCK